MGGISKHWRARARLFARAGAARSAGSALPIVQLVIAVVASYAIAYYLFGHLTPVTAATVTLSSLGFVRDARPLRVLETAIGVTLGITLSEVILLVAGQGLWQLALAVVITLFAARFFSPAPGFAIVAASQSALVAILPVAASGPFTRTVDGVVGGVVALLLTALVPRDARRVAHADAKRVLSTFTRIVEGLVAELRRGDESDIGRVLLEARSTQPLMDQWRGSLDSAIGIAKISPFLRRGLPELARQNVMLGGVDLALRDLRVVTRRLGVVMRDGRPRHELADLLSALAGAVRLLEQSLDDPAARPLVRQNLILVAVKLRPELLFPDSAVVEGSVVMELRPLVMDLLTATGLTPDKARAALPTL
ncbi:FUSC family protein [Subtercola sp. Z020]|uniref:FUSC family protein n=1 Tax=Subtercola sp. Z020 TaxID=2080582 RepID=UPI000CE8B462|nr:FUSC family protein [Subtercola sp. Z020]PPF88539.1 FUSC family protein [Subtercola sp. Z020]